MTREIKGLTDSEVERSYRLHGDNSLKKEKSKGFFGRFIENLSDPIIRILIFAVMLEVILTIGHINYFEIFGILAAIMISATVSTVSEYSVQPPGSASIFCVRKSHEISNFPVFSKGKIFPEAK